MQLSSGYSYTDIQNLLKKILMKASNREITDSIVNEVLQSFIPSSFIGYRSIRSSADGGFYLDPSISENSVGGYEQEKKQLVDLVSIVMNPVKNKVCLD